MDDLASYVLLGILATLMPAGLGVVLAFLIRRGADS